MKIEAWNDARISNLHIAQRDVVFEVSLGYHHCHRLISSSALRRLIFDTHELRIGRVGFASIGLFLTRSEIVEIEIALITHAASPPVRVVDNSKHNLATSSSPRDSERLRTTSFLPFPLFLLR